MKKKAFKKMLAGVSAVAMLGSAMPMTLIADAYSYNNASKMDVAGFADWQTEQNANTKQNGTPAQKGFKYNGGAVSVTQFAALASIDLNTFNITDVAKYQTQEVFATVSPTGPAATNHPLSVVYDVAQAEKDIIAKVKDVTAVTFDMNEKLSDGVSANPNYGKIKTITINMPVNGGNGTAKAMKFEEITFTVIRTQADLVSASDGAFKDANGKTHIILAADLDVTGASASGGSIDTARTDLETKEAAMTTAKVAYDKAVADNALSSAASDAFTNITLATSVVDAAGVKAAIANAIKNVTDAQTAAGTAITAAADVAAAKTAAKEAFNGLTGDLGIAAKNAVNTYIDADTAAANKSDVTTLVATALAEMTTMKTALDAEVDSANTSAAIGDNDEAKQALEDAVALISVTDDTATTLVAYAGAGATVGVNGVISNVVASSPLGQYNAALEVYNAAIADASIQKQISFAADVDINLNGCTLNTNAGVQILGAKMRIWNGTISSKNTHVNDGDKFSTLAGFTKNSTIELYDNAIINSIGTDTTKAVISSEGTVTVCGDNVTVQRNTQTSGKAVELAEGASFIAGDNKYSINGGAVGEVSNSNDPKAETTYKFVSEAIHKFNDNGFEYYNGGSTTDYVDQDLRTSAIDYAFQPAYAVGTTTSAVAGSTLSVDVTNIGQLYWVAQHINNGDYDGTAVVVNLKGELDFSKSPSGLTWTPIDASDTTSLDVNGAYTYTSGTNTYKGYSVLKNLIVNVKEGNAGFIAKSKGGTITNIGVEGGTFKTADKTAFESAFIGQANNGNINNVYVKDAKLTGSGKKGALVGNLNNAQIDHTFTAADCDAVNSVTGDTAKNYLVINGKRQVMGYTNFYDSTRLAAATAANKSGETKGYFMEATTAEFKSGKVAFMLNGHNPEQEKAAGSLTEWGTNGANDATAAVYVGTDAKYPTGAASAKKYSEDIFGQVLSGTTADAYPSFIKGITNTTVDYTGTTGGKPANSFNAAGTAKATNRVFRQIEMTCDGTKTAWAKTGAKFSNKEVNVTKDHETNGSGRCKNCGAYEITTTNFDKTLIPFLSNLDDYGYTKGASDNEKFITLQTIAGLDAIVIDLTKADGKVPDIVKQINDTTTVSGKKQSAYKGLDILNLGGPVADKELGNTIPNQIDNINFIVKDSIICHGYSDNEKKTLGFMVANAADGAFVASTLVTISQAGTGTPLDTTIDGSSISVNDEIIYNDTTSKNFYVTADKTSAPKAVRYATFKNVPATYNATAANQPLAYNFIIKFEGGVKHNDATDYAAVGMGKGEKNWNDSALTFTDTDAKIHTIKNDTCGCEWTEAHNAEYAITNNGHQGKCAVCDRTDGYDSANGFNDGTSNNAVVKPNTLEPHKYETVFTNGNLALKRCTVCGYTSFVKGAAIAFVSERPELSRPESADGSKKYRQAYTFQIAAGDDTIVQYGVIASKDAKKHIDTANLVADAAAANKYFLNTGDGALNTTVLTDAGLMTTSKKAIKTSGEYTLNASLDTADDSIELCGYVIYKTAAGSVQVAVTPIIKNSFYEAAQLEAENYCSIDGSATTEAARKAYVYEMEVSGGFVVKTYGMVYSKSSTTPVTNNTALADVAGTISKTDRAGKFPAGSQAIKYSQGISGTPGDISSRGYLTVTNPKFGSDVELTIYTDAE